ncbi:MAG: hypothetical protein A3H06_00960 [Candidatus Colwellbacteria bacterium RIFCSPLOWO2_12_FULL_44_13]|uniref:Uncharacterized protein n=2 Tax=Candidatus Colwelliibacteriota TaxID=1817904 RepID=A0A1G1Z4M9_9BACT|nr:MAG: hypothetical protein A3F24_02135 [Candidatus Colwellbacteria bacterium RIFCSPHIGHO2_12_FULL_44_17]OGY61031.1 MAG: hypothetical protein A3H06_00960 [Candidatus Colwellbacteria bacterium RIFCSPLOWO2_12_FULL_44_13]
MGMFDQFKAASEMMKGMSPEQIKELMDQAKGAKDMMREEIKKGVEEEIKKREFISREEVQKMIREQLDR